MTEATDIQQELARLRAEVHHYRRQMELSQTYNHDRHGAHQCCPCVEGLKEYPRKALKGPDPDSQ